MWKWQKIAENFANFFLEKIKKIRADLDQFEEYKPSMVEMVFELSNFAALSESDVRKVMSKLETKSCELNIIPTHIVKNYLDTFIPALTHTVNLSLKNGTFYNSWKCALLWPPIKKVERQQVNQKYRPVNNLFFISKLVEKSVQDQYIHHCDISGLNSNFQSAYKCCETALLKILSDLLWSMERQSVTALILLDLSVAFDTVSHTVLLKVLKYKFGVKGIALA